VGLFGLGGIDVLAVTRCRYALPGSIGTVCPRMRVRKIPKGRGPGSNRAGAKALTLTSSERVV
jgi:hypothetical protein